MYAQAAVNDPVLYVGLYSTGDAPSEVDDYHWVFIVGPSHEEARSEGTLYSMEPRHRKEWCWSYSQGIVSLQDLSALLVRLMIAEVEDMDMLQMTMLRWAEEVRMRAQVEWMSVRWVQKVLKSLEEDEGCLGKKMKSFESVEAEGRRLAEMEEKTRNVDIAIRSPVLYATLHPNYRPLCEDDESHWAFLSGPTDETAESERAGHVAKMQLDSGGRPIWGYSRTAIPLSVADDLRVSALIAYIAKLGLLGEMIRDHNITPTVNRTTFTENLKSKTFLRIQEKVEVLEGQPDCFAFSSHKSSMCKEVLDEEVTSNQPGAKPWWPSRPGGKTFCLLRASKMPDHDEAEIVVNLNLPRLEPITMSVAIQIVTGVLGAAAGALLGQNAARQQREKKSEKKCERIATPREIAIRNAWIQEVQRLDQEQIIAENEIEKQRASTWFNVAAKEGEDKHGRGEDEVRKEEKEEEEEGHDEAEADDDDDDDDEGQDRRDDEDVESRDGIKVNEMLDEEAGEKTSTSRPALIRSKVILFADFNQPGSASEGKRLVKEEWEKGKDAMESDEEEDEDDDDEEDGDGDSKDSTEEDEEDDDDDDENEEDSSSDDEDDDEDDSSEDDEENDDYEDGHEEASPNHHG